MATIIFGAAAWIAPRAPPPRMAAPDIDWQQGTVVSNEEVGRGSRLLRIKSETSLNYLPGHILGLEIEAGKGPYTVTRAMRTRPSASASASSARSQLSG